MKNKNNIARARSSSPYARRGVDNYNNNNENNELRIQILENNLAKAKPAKYIILHFLVYYIKDYKFYRRTL